jgi:hypothetical protein
MNRLERRKLPVEEESVEIELSADELLDLSRAHYAARPSSEAPIQRANERALSAPRPGSSMNRSWHSSLVLASIGSVLLLATIATLRSGASEVTFQPEPPSDLSQYDSEQALDVRPAVQDSKPVRVRNPFDKSEVFEFPSGTSEQEAHDAVADVLLQRAIERQAEYDARHGRKRKAT